MTCEMGLKGNLLPENEYDFIENQPSMKFLKCMVCHKPFSGANTTSRMGWRETQISGYCEKCFDSLFNVEA